MPDNVLGVLFQDIADAIRAKTGGTDTMKPAEFPTQIANIPVGGGGSSADVRYVTFIGADGTELYKKPVAVGDDCVDVAAKGLISTPTKESTVAEVYTYSGWSLTEGGATSSSALKNVTEDRTVYAAFTASVRYYTITYYDSDGMTVLKTASLAYGSNPNYMPEKEGHSFVGWTPEMVTVEGDASYTAAWIEAVSFASGSWADIAEVCESGEAANHFKVGDTRIEQNGDNTFEYRIIGINFDDKADGSGKTGITVAVTGANRTLETMVFSEYQFRWYNSRLNFGSDVRRWLLETFVTTLPEQVQNIIKSITKTTCEWYEGTKSVVTTETIFIPSAQEIGSRWGTKSSTSIATEPLGQYPYLSEQANRVFYDADGTAIRWWMRTADNKSAYAIDADYKSASYCNSQTNIFGVLPCFCI
jgi:hypothetical protein